MHPMKLERCPVLVVIVVVVVVALILPSSINVEAAPKTSRGRNLMNDEQDEQNRVDVDDINGYCAMLRHSSDQHRLRQRKHHRRIPDNDANSNIINDADFHAILKETGANSDDGGRCCSGRKDDCSVPYEDTRCYCDAFCSRPEASDCCPDYESYCLGSGESFKPTESKQTSDHTDEKLLGEGPEVTDPIEVGHQLAPEQLEIFQNCLHENLVYNVGEVLKINCKECVCVALSDEFTWSCTEELCGVTQKPVDLGWQAGIYPEFADKAVNELIKEKLGTRPPSEKSAGLSNIRLNVIDDELPEQFDARDRWPGLIGTPLNQGNCGASWAFSTAGVAADRLAIHSRGEIIVRLSAQQLVSCIGNHHQGQTGCHPVSFDRGWWFVRKTGLVSEECYPFSSGAFGDQGRCLLPRTHSELSLATCPTSNNQLMTVYRGSPPYKVEPQEEDMMKEIMLNGPVQAMMISKDDFYTYKSGVYRSAILDDDYHDDSLTKRLHSVKIIGWGTDYSTGNALKYWLCANSWGETWGENGHFRIARGTNESGIETLVVGVWMRGNGKNHRGDSKLGDRNGDDNGKEFDGQLRRRLY